MRDGETMFETWGYVDPAFRRMGIGTRAPGLERPSRPRADGRAGPGAARRRPVVRRRGPGRPPGAAGGPWLRTHSPVLPDAARPDRADPRRAAPDGLELRPVTPDQHRPIHDAQVEAFRDHWGSREPTEHDFEVTYAHKELDTGLWVIAWDGDQIAGVVENWIYPEENATLGVARGWLESISVRRPWRRRGLARALTAASLARLRDAGMVEGMLGVDATNPTGAFGLYEGLGFEIKQREGVYRRTYPV